MQVKIIIRNETYQSLHDLKGIEIASTVQNRCYLDWREVLLFRGRNYRVHSYPSFRWGRFWLWSVFVPDGLPKHLQNLARIWNKISHRALAIDKLKNYLSRSETTFYPTGNISMIKVWGKAYYRLFPFYLQQLLLHKPIIRWQWENGVHILPIIVFHK